MKRNSIIRECPKLNMITVRNLKKSFGDNLVLDDVSFSVEQGQTVVVIGPSGSGKSTMLRCIIGLEKADGGDIIIEGEPLMKNGAYVAEAKAQIGRASCRERV